MATNPLLVIGEVEHSVGIAKATLRMWERRYGFPLPARMANGKRAYPQVQVEKLRIIRQLIGKGLQPARLVALSMASLLELQRAKTQTRRELEPYDGSIVQLIRSCNDDSLQRVMALTIIDMGLERFLLEKAALWNVAVGNAWERSALKVYEEHLYTEGLQGTLRNAISGLPPPKADSNPRALFATFSDELHCLGLMMAHAMFALDGCPCVFLGVQLPAAEIAEAASDYRSDIVALSFSAGSNARKVVAGLKELRQVLPAYVAIWVGGSCPILHAGKLEGITAFQDIAEVRTAIAQWRGARMVTSPRLAVRVNA